MIFDSDLGEFTKRTKRRVFCEVVLLVTTVCLSVSSFSSIVTGWIKVSIVIVMLVYIIGGLVMYPKARNIAASCQVILGDEKIFYSIMGITKEVFFKNIDRVNAIRTQDQVSEIRLKLNDKSIVNVMNIKDMDVLYKKLQEKQKK